MVGPPSPCTTQYGVELQPELQPCALSGAAAGYPADFDEALGKILPEDFKRSIWESINEVHAEAQIVPLVEEFPEKVLAAIEAYEKAHSIDRDLMFG